MSAEVRFATLEAIGTNLSNKGAPTPLRSARIIGISEHGK